MVLELKAHGSYKIQKRDRIVLVRIRDAWNLETAMHYCADMQRTAESMAGAPWAILSDLTHWQLSTPDVAGEVSRQARALDALGRTHNAMVARDHGLRQGVLAQALKDRNTDVELPENLTLSHLTDLLLLRMQLPQSAMQELYAILEVAERARGALDEHERRPIVP